MSSCTTFGLFALAGGTCPANPPNSAHPGPSLHCYYDTTVKTIGGNFLAARLRVYSPPSTGSALPDNTVAYVVAKVYAPAGHDSIIDLDALQIVLAPGDPLSTSYQERLPEIPTFFVGVGQVLSGASMPDDSKAFALSMSEYMDHTTKPFPLICAFPPGPRWQNTRIPPALNCVEFVGVCQDRLPDGVLQINIESFTPSVGPRTTTLPYAATVATASAPSTPRRAKYQSSPSIVSPTAPPSAPQTASFMYQSTSTAAPAAQPIASGSQYLMHPMNSFAPPLATPTVPSRNKKPLPKRAKHSLSQSAGPSSQAFQLDDEYEDDAQLEEEEDEDEDEDEDEPETVRKSARKRKPRTGGQ
ncbi:hypothetical protein C8F01DRAFT_1271494 [Mycena amicta]|nr:hypothetical protein C8F01DRAFT_1271494 [Mycena amicta]